ncbi:hypothetical protein TCAL_04042, partial [Tigriopus californicus]
QDPLEVQFQLDTKALDLKAPALHKCCENGFGFDIETRQCIPVPDNENQVDPRLDPSFLSFFDYVDYDYPEINFQLHADPHLPTCTDREDLEYFGNAQNNHQQGQYAIDDKNLTGSHFILMDATTSMTYEEFCVEQAFFQGLFDGTAAVFCQTKLEFECENRTCINFCCPFQQVFKGSECWEPSGSNLVPLPIFKDDGITETERRRSDFKFLPERPPSGCKYFKYEDFIMLETGEARVYKVDYGLDKYCVEREEIYDNQTGTYSYPFMIVVCQPEDASSKGFLRYVDILDFTIIPTLFVISLIFLALLFIHVYRRNRQKLFGVMTLCLISMLFFFYLLLIIGKIFASLRDYEGLCVLLALLLQYSYLSAIFWLNAMGFDIWTTFRQMKTLPDPSHATGWKHKKFKWYALYSWGAPILVVVVTIAMQYSPMADDTHVVYPGIGKMRCFLDSGWPSVFYLHIIILPLLILNVLFFISSTWNLCCGIWADNSGDPMLRAQNKTKYTTVVKMFFAMGLTWIAEQVSFLLETIYHPSEVKYVTTVFKIINSLQGFTMFCVIYFDAKNIEKISKILNESLRGHASASGGIGRAKNGPDEEMIELKDAPKSPRFEME